MLPSIPKWYFMRLTVDTNIPFFSMVGFVIKWRSRRFRLPRLFLGGSVSCPHSCSAIEINETVKYRCALLILVTDLDTKAKEQAVRYNDDGTAQNDFVRGYLRAYGQALAEEKLLDLYNSIVAAWMRRVRREILED
jgi:hypothetical protein